MNWRTPQIEHGKPTEYGWTVYHPECLTMGENVDIGKDTNVFAHNGVEIGDNAQLGGGCFLYTKDTIGGNAGSIKIGDCACIGSGTRIFPNVEIGDGAIIGAMSMIPVGTVIPAGEFWAGIPAKRKKLIAVVTGGTGSIGRSIVEEMLELDCYDSIRVISRDESRQADMREELNSDSVRYILGDVRNRDTMARAFKDAHIVIHAAALKRVESCEYSADEAADINVNGTRAVAAAALEAEVKKILLISTDKAAHPVNAMGASKLMAEKIFLGCNRWSKRPQFYVVRLGNILNSRGSVLPTWHKQGDTITVTEPDATRFYLTKQEAARFILGSLYLQPGLHIPKCKCIKLADLASAFCKKYNASIKAVGMRPGEKLHEWLCTEDEAIERGLSPEEYQSDKAPLLTISEIGELI